MGWFWRFKWKKLTNLDPARPGNGADFRWSGPTAKGRAAFHLDVGTRAETLVTLAAEKLELAEARLRAAETVSYAAEIYFNEARLKIEEFEKALHNLETRIVAVAPETSVGIVRNQSVGTYIAESESALKQLEDSIRQKLLMGGVLAASPAAAAAA